MHLFCLIHLMGELCRRSEEHRKNYDFVNDTNIDYKVYLLSELSPF